MKSEYRDAALSKVEFYPSQIRDGDYDDEIQEKALVYSDDVSDVINKIESDVNDILNAVSRMKKQAIADIEYAIDDVYSDLETLAEKLY